MPLNLRLDTTITANEEVRFKQKHSALIRRLACSYHFTYAEVEGLVVIYYKIWKSGNYPKQRITRKQLEKILYSSLGITNSKMLENIISTVCKGSNKEVSIGKWVKLLSLLLRGTLEQQIKFCFKVYRGYMNHPTLKRPYLLYLMKGCLVGESDEENLELLKDMIDLILYKMDLDRDGSISFEDYSTSVRNDPQLLEAFGHCIPSRMDKYAFLSTFSKTPGKL